MSFGRILGLLGVLALAVLLGSGPPPAVDCPCDHGRPETLSARVCGLCRTAEEQTEEIYFLKDINPSKPNRYLALPKQHDRGIQHTSDLPEELRVRYWKAAIAKAESLFGESWGLAVNGHFFRTQCHAHIHMGPLSPQIEDIEGTLYNGPAEFPAVGPGHGLWVHAKEGRFCVHLNRALAEVVLVR
jgi:diadenosine tetraphosphate (Ap4A) HIT family hydrolase